MSPGAARSHVLQILWDHDRQWHHDKVSETRGRRECTFAFDVLTCHKCGGHRRVLPPHVRYL